jgi:hypothetical protein
MREQHETVIMGAGQAGLARSTVLQQDARDHVVLERRWVGERWRTERWDSLRFSSPTGRCSCPATHTEATIRDGFCHYSEIVRIIEDYAASTRAPVRENTEVVGLTEDADGKGFQKWVRQRLSEPLQISAAARDLGISGRTCSARPPRSSACRRFTSSNRSGWMRLCSCFAIHRCRRAQLQPRLAIATPEPFERWYASGVTARSGPCGQGEQQAASNRAMSRRCC